MTVRQQTENTSSSRASPLDNPPCDLPAYSKVAWLPDPEYVCEQWVLALGDVPTRCGTD